MRYKEVRGKQHAASPLENTGALLRSRDGERARQRTLNHSRVGVEKSDLSSLYDTLEWEAFSFNDRLREGGREVCVVETDGNGEGGDRHR